DPAHPEVALLTPPWSKRGEADRWLTSEAFGLASGRSLEAEQLTNEASRLLADTPVDPDRAQALNIQLGRHLGDHDPFWLRWRFLGEQQGWLK
ncbi:MAG: hypothetical protein RIR00_888, partial [Pseudomonadota bacterium]